MNESLKRAGYRLALYSIFGVFIPLIFVWSLLIIHFTFGAVNIFFDLIYTGLTVYFFFFMKDVIKSVRYFCIVSLVISIWYLFIPASNNREWQDDVKLLPKIVQTGSEITIENFRNFSYKDGKPLDMNYETRSYNLDDLEGTDMIISYWDGYRTIGHTFICFRFKGGKSFAVSLEVRKEKGESYSPAKGLFKQYELIYVFGDEKDLIPLRTKHRGEETFLYPMTLTLEQSKTFLLGIMDAANDLHTNPKFYHSLNMNCTTTLIKHLNKVKEFKIPVLTKFILNGITDYIAYEMKGIPTDIPFDILKRCCYISRIANDIPLNDDYPIELRKQINERLSQERNNLK